MVELIIGFLALLNPFALFIYTLPLSKEKTSREYRNIITRASLISYLIFVFFALFGNVFFDKILNIEFDSFRIFGGILLIAFALSYILQGKNTLIQTRGELSQIASEVALPFMVGAGTITLSIVIGTRLGYMLSIFTLGIIMLINFVTLVVIELVRKSMQKRAQEVLDKNLDILLRINGFIVGAFGVNLVVIGVRGIVG